MRKRLVMLYLVLLTSIVCSSCNGEKGNNGTDTKPGEISQEPAGPTPTATDTPLSPIGTPAGEIQGTNAKIEATLLSIGSPTDEVEVEVLFTVNCWEEAEEQFAEKYPEQHRLVEEVRNGTSSGTGPEYDEAVTEAFELRAKMPSICLEQRAKAFLERHPDMAEKVLPDLFMQFVLRVTRNRIPEIATDTDVAGVIPYVKTEDSNNPVVIGVIDGHPVCDGPDVELFFETDIPEKGGVVLYRMLSVSEKIAEADDNDYFRLIVLPSVAYSARDKYPDTESAMNSLMGETFTAVERHKSYLIVIATKKQLTELSPKEDFYYNIYWASQKKHHPLRFSD